MDANLLLLNIYDLIFETTVLIVERQNSLVELNVDWNDIFTLAHKQISLDILRRFHLFRRIPKTFHSENMFLNSIDYLKKVQNTLFKCIKRMIKIFYGFSCIRLGDLKTTKYLSSPSSLSGVSSSTFSSWLAVVSLQTLHSPSVSGTSVTFHRLVVGEISNQCRDLKLSPMISLVDTPLMFFHPSIFTLVLESVTYSFFANEIPVVYVCGHAEDFTCF